MWTDLPIIFVWLIIFFFWEINSLRDSLLFQLDISSVRCLVDGSDSSKAVRLDLFYSHEGTNVLIAECKLFLQSCLYALTLLKIGGCLLILIFIFGIILIMHFFPQANRLYGLIGFVTF